MTRQEAYEYLKDYLDSVFHNSNDYETYCYLRDCADTLAPPDPAPDTGLVPCGCGGVAKLYHRHSTILPKQILWVVQCVKFGKCGISTPDCTRKQDAIALWNLAMGYRA